MSDNNAPDPVELKISKKDVLQLSCPVDEQGRFPENVVDASTFKKYCLGTVPPAQRKYVYVNTGAGLKQSIEDGIAHCAFMPLNSKKPTYMYCNILQEPVSMDFYMGVPLDCGFQFNNVTKTYETDIQKGICYGKLDHPVPNVIPLIESIDGTCGPEHNSTKCPKGQCCGTDGICGCTYDACVVKYSNPYYSGGDTELCKYN